MAAAKTLSLIFFLLSLYFSTSFSHVSISVTPKTLTKSSNTVRIQWTGVESPTDLDWLGIYSPPNSPDEEFIGYLFLNSSATYLSGSGSISVPLTNLRSNYQFRVFRWTRSEVNYRHLDYDRNPIPGVKHKLAASEEVGFGSEAAGPDQIHLAFTDRADEMRVVFVMGDGEAGRVRYGVEKGRLEKEVGTEVRRYEMKDMCDSPANSRIGWRDPGFIHDGVMAGLEKGRRYYYQVS